jgi:hypothetical protein
MRGRWLPNTCPRAYRENVRRFALRQNNNAILLPSPVNKQGRGAALRILLLSLSHYLSYRTDLGLVCAVKTSLEGSLAIIFHSRLTTQP